MRSRRRRLAGHGRRAPRLPRRVAGGSAQKTRSRSALLADLRGTVHGARRGRPARRRAGGQASTTAWPAARRSRSSRARPTPRRTAPSRADPQAGRAGRRQDPGRPALGRRRPRGQGLRQDPAASDLRQRHVGRAGHDAARSGAELLPLLHRRRAVDGRPRHLRLRPRATRRSRPSPRTIPSPTTQVLGFMAEFCKAGRHGRRRSPGCRSATRTFPRSSPAIPTDVDAIYVALGGADARQLPDPVPAGRRRQAADRRLDHRRPDGADLQGQAARRRCSARLRPDRSPTPYDTPAWKKFVADYKATFPDGFPSPSLFAHGYYINTKAVLLGARRGQRRPVRRRRKLRDALAEARASTRRPGTVKLDENRNAIGDIFVTEVAKGADGNLYNKVVKVVPTGQPDARHAEGRVREARPRSAATSRLSVSSALTDASMRMAR